MSGNRKLERATASVKVFAEPNKVIKKTIRETAPNGRTRTREVDTTLYNIYKRVND